MILYVCSMHTEGLFIEDIYFHAFVMECKWLKKKRKKYLEKCAKEAIQLHMHAFAYIYTEWNGKNAEF